MGKLVDYSVSYIKQDLAGGGVDPGDYPHALATKKSRIISSARVLAVTGIYFLAAKFGLAFATTAEQVTLIWPSTGIALAVMLLLGYRLWPAVLAGGFLVNLTANEPFIVAAAIACGNTLEAVGAAWLINRYSGAENYLGKVRHVLLFILFCAAGASLAATIGVTSLCMGGVQPWDDFQLLWLTWWLGDAAGAMIVAPLLLVWGRAAYSIPSPGTIVEFVVLASILVIASVFIFILPTPGNFRISPYLITPFVIWIALRFGQRGVTLGTLLLTGLAVAATLYGSGPFSYMPIDQALVSLPIFMILVGATGLFLGAARFEHQHARQQILETAERSRVILDSAHDAIVSIGKDMLVNEWNKKAEEIFGWTHSFANGKSIDTLIIAPEHRQIFREAIKGFLTNNSSATPDQALELSGINSEGNIVPVELKLSITTDKITAIIKDITYRKTVEKQRASAEEIQRRFAAIINSSEDAIISKNLEGIITSWNTGAERLFGYTASEAIGQPITLLIPLDRLAEENTIMERLRRADHINHFETVRITKDGRLIDISLTISPIIDSAGRIIGAAKIARDITERKQIEMSLREMDRRKDEFLAMLSHELRNPIAPIYNALELMSMEEHESVLQREARQIIHREIRHMSRLVNDLLEISRITTGMIKLQVEQVDLNVVIANAVERLRAQIYRRKQEIIVSLPPEPVMMQADPTRLEQVIGNILHNASKYNEIGGHIWLNADVEAGNATIRIRDDGIGISREMLPKIFDAFMQVDKSLHRSDSGLGIGLSLVKNLVELHHGTIEAFSEGSGRGSEFVLRLPLALTEHQHRFKGPAQPAAAAIPCLRILIVDDHVDLTRLTAMLLKAWGHYVRTANSGLEAIREVESFRPDIVFMDIGMPDMDGYEVARLIRGDPQNDRTLLVAVTGYAQVADRLHSKEVGFDVHLTKPVEQVELRRILVEYGSQAIM